MKIVTCAFCIGLLATFATHSSTPQTTVMQPPVAGELSVVGLIAMDDSGRVLVRNSGVVIVDGMVVSSCHVLTDIRTSKLTVEYRHQYYPAKVHKLDLADDICSFVSIRLPAPAAVIDKRSTLSVGERVYAVGVKAGGMPYRKACKVLVLQEFNGMVVKKLDIPIPEGVVGGGLFNRKGKLVGVDLLGADISKQGGIALPLDELDDLRVNGVSYQSYDVTHNVVSGALLQLVDRANSGDYASIIEPLMSLAKAGNMHAQFVLSGMYLGGDGVSRNKKQAYHWLIKSANSGSVIAQDILGIFYLVGQKDLPEDHSKAVYWLTKAAQGSSSDAQFVLGSMYLVGHGVPQDSSKGIELLRQSSDQGLGKAQFMLAVAYTEGNGVERDFVQAAKWFLLANGNGSKHAFDMLSDVEGDMSPAQIAKANQLAKIWLSQHPY